MKLFLLPLVAVLVLSGCQSMNETWDKYWPEEFHVHGYGQDSSAKKRPEQNQSFERKKRRHAAHRHDKSHRYEQRAPRKPAPVYTQPSQEPLALSPTVIKPLPVPERAMPTVMPQAEWHEVGDYDSFRMTSLTTIETANPPVPAMPEVEPLTYGRGVVVYPLDGDKSPYELPAQAFTTYPESDDGLPTSLITSQGVELMRQHAREHGFDTPGEMVAEIYFAHGSSALSQTDKRVIGDLADKVIAMQPSAVIVVGHASKRVDGIDDPIKAAMINFEMSMKRAAAVTEQLYRSGVNPNWVEAVSKGDREPNARPAGRTQETADRRVEIFVDGALD